MLIKVATVSGCTYITVTSHGRLSLAKFSIDYWHLRPEIGGWLVDSHTKGQWCGKSHHTVYSQGWVIHGYVISCKWMRITNLPIFFGVPLQARAIMFIDGLMQECSISSTLAMKILALSHRYGVRGTYYFEEPPERCHDFLTTEIKRPRCFVMQRQIISNLKRKIDIYIYIY